MRIVETVAVGAIIAAAAMVALGPVPSAAHWSATLFFTTFGLLASVLEYKTSSSTHGSISFLPFLAIAVVAPNAAALATVFVSTLVSELIARREPLKILFNVSQYVFAEAMAVAAFVLFGGVSILDGQPPIPAFLVLVAVFMTLNKLAVSTVVAVASESEVKGHWTRSMQSSALYDVLAFPLIYFVAVAYAKFGPGLSAALALPIFGIRQQYKANIALQKNNEEFLQLMVDSIEARDPYTSGHSQRVSRYARIIAKAAGLSRRATERVVTAALIHDVGKIHEEFAPILRKPGRLTDQEFDVMKSHPDRGATLVEKVTNFADLVPAVRSHHEAWDGRGYPKGLAGDGIPLGARVIALADTIDAMSTSRPYRLALSSDTVRAELERESGRQFDPRICRALLTDIQWNEIVREIAIATREFPVLVAGVEQKHPEESRAASGRMAS